MILRADALHIPLADEIVQCCVTSPPYWGLRDYGACSCGSRRFSEGQGEGTGGNLNYRPSKGFDPGCQKCHGTGRIAGTDAQLGLEPTPEEYVANMVAVFREVKRVLRPDGTLWLNLGDSYASGGTGGASSKSTLNGGRGVGPAEKIKQGPAIQRACDTLAPKQLVGIPWRVAFALQADGWWLRSDIIWAKPNPMPESVTDRPTKSHEYMFLLTKSARYYYDAEAVREPFADDRMGCPGSPSPKTAVIPGQTPHTLATRAWVSHADGRNRRTVWTIATRPYGGAHFATFPPDLVEPCIKAGTKPGDVVLDPFGGSGTVAAVCRKWGRECVSMDINPAYLELQRERVAAVVQPAMLAFA